MTKEERMKVLFEESVKEYKDVSGEKELDIADYKDAVWKNLRIECAQKEDIEESSKWLFGVIANYIKDTFNDQGVYDVLLCVARKGDFDSSEEGHARRAMLKEAQQKLQEKLTAGYDAIEAEYDDKEDVH